MDKIVHFGLYAVLGFTTTRAWGGGWRDVWGATLVGFVIAVCFGGTLEWLQERVGRDSSWGDFGADAVGAATGVLVWAVRRQ